MVMVSVSESVFTSVTCSLTVKAPVAVGVPEITPVTVLMLKPAGRPVADQAFAARIAPEPAVTVFVIVAGEPA